MNQQTTSAIILSRLDYGEADRIITVLTPDYGKLRLMAKGVRRVKSKLAGGIELFSVSHITFIKGHGDIGTLVSTRLVKHYSSIVDDIARVQLGYTLIKQLNRLTEDEPDATYFSLLEDAFAALNDKTIDQKLVETWFYAQLLHEGGLAPNLSTAVDGSRLDASKTYNFSFDDSAFVETANGRFASQHIKLLRLLFTHAQPKTLQQVQGIGELLQACYGLTHTMAQQHLAL